MSVVIRSQAQWPLAEEEAAPGIAGFVTSTFSPVAAEAARRCLAQVTSLSEQTAVIIVSASGDLGTAVATAKAVDAGQRPGPLLFFQAVPNAVAGHIAARHGLAGPVICLSPQGFTPDSGPDEGLKLANLLIRDGDAEEALIISIEQNPGGGRDSAVALLVKRE
jgi:3-oxoacyl-(acyl-carrier-protein) synthase